MVEKKHSDKLENNKGDRLTFKSVYLLLFFVIILGGVLVNNFSGLFKNKPELFKDENDISNGVSSHQIESRLDNKIIDMIPDIFIYDKLREGVFLGVKGDLKDIYAYDINNNSLKKIIRVKDEGNFIKSLSCNSDWIVWVENEVLIMDTSNKPFKWQIVAQNILTGEQIVIDKSPFSSNKFEVPMHIDYTPNKVSISNEDVVVYCRNDFRGAKIISELICYDIKSKERKVIAQTSDVIKELIMECNIYGDNIVWSRFRELNDDYEYRFTRYKYSDLYIYNIKTDKTEQLTKDDFYHDAYIFEDKVVAIYVPPNKPNQTAYNSEVVLMNLNDKKFNTIVHEDSPCYRRKEDEMVRCSPKIDSKYISWSNSGGFSNRFIYDYKNNKFIEIYDGTEDAHDNTIVMYDRFSNYALFYIAGTDGDIKKFCVIINDIK